MPVDGIPAAIEPAVDTITALVETAFDSIATAVRPRRRVCPHVRGAHEQPKT